MVYRIKQQQVKRILEVNPLFLEGENYDTMSSEQRAYKLIAGNLRFLSLASAPRIDFARLDLTYDTIKSLFAGVTDLFVTYISYNFDLKTTIQVLESTIATYFILLAINEHNATLNITPNSDPNVLGGCDILLENKGIRVDLLKDITGKISFADHRLTIYIKELMESYKSLTGKDLEEYGLDNIEIYLK